MNTLKSALCALAVLTGVSAFAAGIDVQQSPTNYFVPTDAQKTTSPYYRGASQDWGWTHGGIDTTSALTANLDISAFDVDYTAIGWIGERDLVEAYDANTSSWISLGYLAGGDNVWAFTTFSLNLGTFANDIMAGLQVRMNVDTTNEGWYVTLAKSVLTVDYSSLPPPAPSVPDSASSLALLAAGLAALGAYRRKLVA